MEQVDHWTDIVHGWEGRQTRYHWYLYFDRSSGAMEIELEAECDSGQEYWECSTATWWQIDVKVDDGSGELFLREELEVHDQNDGPGTYSLDTTVNPGEKAIVDFRMVNYQGTYDFELTAYKQALQVTNVSASAEQDDIAVEATVENRTDTEFTVPMQTWFNESDFGTRDVTVPGNSSEQVTFSITGVADGTHEICAEMLEEPPK